MSTTENEEVAASETPAAASDEAENVETKAVEAEGTGVTDPAGESADGDDDESLDIEVEVSDEGGGEVEVDPIAELEAKLAEAEKGKATNYDRFVRATADLENVRKRTRREVKDARIDERGKIIRDVLPVADNLERALEHAEQSMSEATKSIVEGVQMVLRQFKQSLERHNVKALEAVGKPFDPAVHEAVSQAPSDEYPAGTVIAVLQTGYMIEERLLRPTLAVVSVAMPQGESDEKSESEADESDAGPDSEDEAESEGQE